MALYTQEGLRFDNEESAISWFLTTLQDKSPLGELYEKLHAEDWGEYDIQATGISDQEYLIRLDAPDLRSNIFRRVNINTYNQPVKLEYNVLKKNIDSLIKATNIASITAYSVLADIQESIKKGDENLLNDVITDFKEMVLSVQAELDAIDGRIVIQLTDKVKSTKYSSYITLDEQLRLDVDKIKPMVEGMFKKSLQGKFDADGFKVDGVDLKHLLDYADLHKNTLKVEILDI
ncbi:MULTISPECIES: hypothetical protein [Staphylococcus]|uniref:Uncharacterized protein n=2 Tax=Staphylococcus TaxID=1279 RepID=A0ABX3Z3S8_9STAP|nr:MULTISPECIES: hypothetical protein [Staphylococcus]MDG4943889.1 hypothetical protein [Staphylococcus agnetis]MDP4448280.1 hypothetical protein [Staphylococcus hyicus]MDP4459804.1 hypothetical protein [Staphylococcus hyicus]MDP4462564.1 hypothetical protein [Staphylococcus hyicus]OSP22546.1 hypothetical protein B9L42_00255 [Staphylococcus agnetis]